MQKKMVKITREIQEKKKLISRVKIITTKSLPTCVEFANWDLPSRVLNSHSASL